MCCVLNVGQWFANGTKPSDSLGLAAWPKVENTVIQCTWQRLLGGKKKQKNNSLIFCKGTSPVHHPYDFRWCFVLTLAQICPLQEYFNKFKLCSHFSSWKLLGICVVDVWTQVLLFVRSSFFPFFVLKKEHECRWLCEINTILCNFCWAAAIAASAATRF